MPGRLTIGQLLRCLIAAKLVQGEGDWTPADGSRQDVCGEQADNRLFNAGRGCARV